MTGYPRQLRVREAYDSHRRDERCLDSFMLLRRLVDDANGLAGAGAPVMADYEEAAATLRVRLAPAATHPGVSFYVVLDGDRERGVLRQIQRDGTSAFTIYPSGD